MKRKRDSIKESDEFIDEHQDICWICNMGGNLLCCDTCTLSFHLKCAGLRSVPKGSWSCSVCANSLNVQREMESSEGESANEWERNADRKRRALTSLDEEKSRKVTMHENGVGIKEQDCDEDDYEDEDLHDDVCYICDRGGNLLCCDSCSLAFHLRCAKLRSFPKGDWSCGVCTGIIDYKEYSDHENSDPTDSGEDENGDVIELEDDEEDLEEDDEIYSCECGETFAKLRSYQSHRSNCQVLQTTAPEYDQNEDEDENQEEEEDVHDDKCNKCDFGGNLLCCDTCSLAWHLKCANLRKIPDGEWSCPVCVESEEEEAACQEMNDDKGMRRSKTVDFKIDEEEPEPTKRSSQSKAKVIINRRSKTDLSTDDDGLTLIVKIDPVSNNVVAKYYNEYCAASSTMCYIRDIVKVLNGVTSSAGGFKWRRERTFIEQLDPNHDDKNGDMLIVGTHTSAKLAAEALYKQIGDKSILEEGSNSITNCCRDLDNNKYCGYKWKLHGFDHLKFDTKVVETSSSSDRRSSISFDFNSNSSSSSSSSLPSSSLSKTRAQTPSSSNSKRERYSRQVTRSKEVCRVEPSTGAMTYYSNPEFAAKANRFSHYPEAEITNCCNGFTTRAGGYIWKWSVDVNESDLTNVINKISPNSVAEKKTPKAETDKSSQREASDATTTPGGVIDDLDTNSSNPDHDSSSRSRKRTKVERFSFDNYFTSFHSPMAHSSTTPTKQESESGMYNFDGESKSIQKKLSRLHRMTGDKSTQHECACGKIFPDYKQLGGHKVKCMKSWSKQEWERENVLRNGARIAVDNILNRNVGIDKFDCVEQYSLQGELIEKFEDVRTAELFTGTWKRDILRCLRRQIRYANGFVWIGTKRKKDEEITKFTDFVMDNNEDDDSADGDNEDEGDYDESAAYKCPCGAQFDSFRALGGHKVACMRTWGPKLHEINNNAKKQEVDNPSSITIVSSETGKDIQIQFADVAIGSDCIEQYTLDGELVAKYEDGDAAERITKTWKHVIARCIDGKIGQASGFVWKRGKAKKGDDIIKYPNKTRPRQKDRDKKKATTQKTNDGSDDENVDRRNDENDDDKSHVKGNLPDPPAEYCCPCGKMFSSHLALGGHKVTCMKSWSQRLWDIDENWKKVRSQTTSPNTNQRQQQQQQLIQNEEKHSVAPLTNADDFECVEQFSLEGELLAKYADLDTAEVYTSTWKRDIMRCIKGNIEQAGKFKWRGGKIENGDDVIPYPNDQERGKKWQMPTVILQIDTETHQVIAKYRNEEVAASHTSVPTEQICACINRKIRHAGGYKWQLRNAKRGETDVIQPDFISGVKTPGDKDKLSSQCSKADLDHGPSNKNIDALRNGADITSPSNSTNNGSVLDTVVGNSSLKERSRSTRSRVASKKVLESYDDAINAQNVVRRGERVRPDMGDYVFQGNITGNVFCHCCHDSTVYDNDSIVYCDNCDVGVHQSCYGVVEIPEGEWFCNPCAAGLDPSQLRCELCPHTGGAYKPVSGTKNKWVHCLCAAWIPEARCVDLGRGEPYDLTQVYATKRLTLRCRLKSCMLKAQKGSVKNSGADKLCYRAGACVQCSSAKCYESMHPLCVLEEGSGCAYKLITVKQKSRIQVFCPKHAHEADSVKEDFKANIKSLAPSDNSVHRNNNILQPNHNLLSNESVSATPKTVIKSSYKGVEKNTTNTDAKIVNKNITDGTLISSKITSGDNSGGLDVPDASMDVDVISSLLQLSEAKVPNGDLNTQQLSSASKSSMGVQMDRSGVILSANKPRRGRPPKNGYSLEGLPLYGKESRVPTLSCPYDLETCTDSPVYIVEEYDVIHKNVLARYINMHAMCQHLEVTMQEATSLINKAHRAQRGPAYRWVQKTQLEIIHDKHLLYEKKNRTVNANKHTDKGPKKARGRPRKVFSEAYARLVAAGKSENPYSKNYSYSSSSTIARRSDESYAYANEICILDTVRVDAFGLGKVVDIRVGTDGIYRVELLNWKLAGRQLPVCYVPKSSIKLVEKASNDLGDDSYRLSDRATRSFAKSLLPMNNTPARSDLAQRRLAVSESRVGAVKYQAQIPSLLSKIDVQNGLSPYESSALNSPAVWRPMSTDYENTATEILRRLRKRNLYLNLRKGMVLPVYRGRGASMLSCVIDVNGEIVKVFDGAFTFDVNMRHCEMSSTLYDEMACEAIHKLGVVTASANLDALHHTALQLYSELYGHRKVPQALGAIASEGSWTGAEVAVFCDAYTNYGGDLKRIHALLANSRSYAEVLDFFTTHEPSLGDSTKSKAVKGVYAMKDRILKSQVMTSAKSS